MGRFTLTQLCLLVSVQLPDAIEWMLYVWHYLDVFILLGLPGTNHYSKDVKRMLDRFHELGVPVAENKLEGQSMCLTFLGIEIDLVQIKLRMLEDKLERVKTLVTEWQGQRSCWKRELESLIHHLSRAC